VLKIGKTNNTKLTIKFKKEKEKVSYKSKKEHKIKKQKHDFLKQSY
jgi:hypothetical protein